ncbi:MAG: XTP/dITP diphosphatase [Clostridia bacterium]|nr:XTP/dITP diphosphatase [Clostridia bacterium]
MNIVIASNNAHKIDEIKQIIGEYFDKIYSLKELSVNVEVEETGSTFYENALLKAREVSRITGMTALADDSGLEVDALNGAPGVYSARFAGEGATDAKNNALLLEKLQGISDRKAAFVSCIIIFFPGGGTISAEGRTYGEIGFAEKGEGGFGYDPLFYSYDLKKTFAEACSNEKNGVSHRGRALHAVRQKLEHFAAQNNIL